jgi:hypothetical protein
LVTHYREGERSGSGIPSQLLTHGLRDSAPEWGMRMTTWNYLHRIEYRREYSTAQRVHEYTELVEDMGWCFSHKKEQQDKWLSYYTTVCAEEYLDRVMAAPGKYLVSVYQQRPDERVHVCTVRLSHGTLSRSARQRR